MQSTLVYAVHAVYVVYTDVLFERYFATERLSQNDRKYDRYFMRG